MPPRWCTGTAIRGLGHGVECHTRGPAAARGDRDVPGRPDGRQTCAAGHPGRGQGFDLPWAGDPGVGLVLRQHHDESAGPGRRDQQHDRLRLPPRGHRRARRPLSEPARCTARGESRRPRLRHHRRHPDRHRPLQHPRTTEGVDLWWSGKHHTRGGNIQVIGVPDGWPIWTSDVRPGREHDTTAARTETEILPALGYESLGRHGRGRVQENQNGRRKRRSGCRGATEQAEGPVRDAAVYGRITAASPAARRHGSRTRPRPRPARTAHRDLEVAEAEHRIRTSFERDHVFVPPATPPRGAYKKFLAKGSRQGLPHHDQEARRGRHRPPVLGLVLQISRSRRPRAAGRRRLACLDLVSCSTTRRPLRPAASASRR
ncbi:hypothetical protein J2S42_001862 [Catenuloplanes indicus]|uniref:DDE Tnp4 domain-containing protein n=1 Tax=Catenuloplanes indicus TaxID=137267 RepID=A0AAE4AYM5_9ACTN|nr:hypothetical protein [Catenuloplanes indicus]